MSIGPVDYGLFVAPIQQRLHLLETAELADADNAGQLSSRLAHLEQTVLELSITCATLAAALGERGAVDIQAVSARASAEIAKVHARGPMATCGACGRVVPERMTVITASGTMCDVCAAGARPE